MPWTKLIATSKSEQNRAALDPWTVVHLGMGLAAGLVDLHRETAFGAAVAYEVVEQFFERSRSGQEFFETSGPESLANVAADLGAFALGYWLGERWNRGGDRR